MDGAAGAACDESEGVEGWLAGFERERVGRCEEGEERFEDEGEKHF